MYQLDDHHIRSITSKKSRPSTFPIERPALAKKKATLGRMEKMVVVHRCVASGSCLSSSHLFDPRGNRLAPHMRWVARTHPLRLEIQFAMRLDVPRAHGIARAPFACKLWVLPRERSHDLAARGAAVIHALLPIAHRFDPFMPARHTTPPHRTFAPALYRIRRVIRAVDGFNPFFCKLGVCIAQILLISCRLRAEASAYHTAVDQIAIRRLIRTMSVRTTEVP